MRVCLMQQMSGRPGGEIHIHIAIVVGMATLDEGPLRIVISPGKLLSTSYLYSCGIVFNWHSFEMTLTII